MSPVAVDVSQLVRAVDASLLAPVADLPLFLGVPGGVELLVILLIAIVMFGLPVVLLGGGFYLYRRSQSERPASDEIAALRREVEHLREEIRQLENENGRGDNRSSEAPSNDEQ